VRVEDRDGRRTRAEQQGRQQAGTLLKHFPRGDREEETGRCIEDSPLALNETVVDPGVQHPEHTGCGLGEPLRMPEHDHGREAGEEERGERPEPARPRTADELDADRLNQSEGRCKPRSHRSRAGAEDGVDLEQVPVLERRP
jgi:hypothetical protein